MKLITKSIDCQKYEYTTVQRRTDIDLSNNTTILLFSQDITIRQILTRNIKLKQGDKITIWKNRIFSSSAPEHQCQ